MIIGAMRGGTTTLYNGICSHPQVNRTRKKELHYYCFYYQRGLEWYKQQFQEGFGGEASPFYMRYSQSAERIYKDFPNTKIIAILRNPIERAFSHYCYASRQWGMSSFEDEVAWEGVYLNQYQEGSFEYMIHSILGMSRYYEQLKRYYDLFENILVLQSELYFQNYQATFDKVWDFLDLPNYKVELKYRQNKYQYMLSYTRDYLTEYFREHNQKLFELIGKEFEWI